MCSHTHGFESKRKATPLQPRVECTDVLEPMSHILTPPSLYTALAISAS